MNPLQRTIIEKAGHDNGFLLVANLDALFDRDYWELEE